MRDDDDVMRVLRESDPAARTGLGSVDPAALAALRDGVLRTSPEAMAVPRGRARTRRGVVAVAVGTLLLGGGVAYAAVQQGRFVGRGFGADTLTCMSQWVDPNRPEALEAEVTGGSVLTGDPVADCQTYQELSGLPPIDDAVAFEHGGMTFVAPRDEVPEGAVVAEPGVDDAQVFELWTSLNDSVDGMRAQCLTGEDAVVAAQAELDRLGLADWTVTTRERRAGSEAGPCAVVTFEVDPVVETSGIPIAAADRALVVVPEAADPFDDFRGGDISEEFFVLRDTLRAEIAESCVDVRRAEEIAVAALGDLLIEPVSVIPDDTACTRVDLTGGGGANVTVRGPEPTAVPTTVPTTAPAAPQEPPASSAG